MSELYDHQLLALRKLSNGKILWGGVGSGKTRVAAEYYKLREAPRDVYVITTAKKRDDFDWQQEFYKLDVGPRTGPVVGPRSSDWDDGVLEGRTETGELGERTPGVFGEAGVYPYVLTVDSWNNIAKYADVAGAFFIFDEQRLVGSGDWSRKFLRIAKRNHWILLTATPGDTWMDYIPVFIANGFYKNRSEAIREHVVYNSFTKFPKVERYINVGRLARQRHQILVEMPFERHTKRRHVEVPLPYDKAMLERVLKERWHVYEERPLRDVAEMFSVMRKVVNGDPSRLEMVCELWQKHPRLIVFYNFNYELAALRSLVMPLGGISITDWESSSKTSLQPSTIQKTQESLGLKSSLMMTSVAAKGSSPTPHPCETAESEWTKNTLLLPNGDGLQEETQKQSFRAGFTDIYENNTSLGKTSSGVESSSATTIRIAEYNGHKHEPVPTTDRWLYLVQYTAGAEGWNCITTDAMVMYSRNYSWKVTEQAYGRIDRLNTPFTDLWYYNFTSDSMIDRAIERSLNAKETFNEAKFKGLFQ